MAWPATIDLFPGTAAQGTSLLTTPDHASDHRTLGSALGTVETILGTNSSSGGIFNSFAGADKPARQQGGTFQAAYQGTLVALGQGTNNGTVTAGAYGSATLIAPTITGAGTNAGTIITGAYNGGTFGTVVSTGAFSNGNISGNGTINWANGDVQFGTLTGNGTLAYSNTSTWQRLTLCLVQDGTGGRTITLPASQYPGSVAPTFGTAVSQWNAIVVIKNSAGSFLTQTATAFG